MLETTKFLLDSGDPDQYQKLSELANKRQITLWGSTTNPTLIAKKLAEKKISHHEAFQLQKQIALDIIKLVPGAVSAEVYADEQTKAQEMIEQGRDIASWHKRIVVKLPTTLEGFKARTTLRKESIPVNNTLVFSQEQIFAICLHEKIMQKQFGPINDLYPPFISPFVGRLDDIGLNGMDLVEHGMHIKRMFDLNLPQSKLAIWMLEASVRSIDHLKLGILLNCELITAPAKVYEEWFALSEDQQKQTVAKNNSLKPILLWKPPQEFFAIETVEEFDEAISSGKITIKHDLTDLGIIRFANDWKAIISS